jgi:antitoxin ChpS
MKMHRTNLRKVGGSVMMVVPPAVLERLDLRVGSVVGMEVEGQRLVIEGRKRPSYKLEELLRGGAEEPLTGEDRQWVEMTPVGKEL